MNAKKYIVTCRKCHGQSEVEINDIGVVKWLELGQVISARQRFDMQMGWQCICGNNDLMTAQEKRTIKNYSQPMVDEMSKIMNNLKPQEPKFDLRTI